MATKAPVSEMLVIVKAREIQRAMFAEMRNDRSEAVKHFLAAAHLEMVLADDYAAAGQRDHALRSQLSAASCLWKGGEDKQARTMFQSLIKKHASKAKLIRSAMADLEAGSE